jgi:hypothetical protein
LAGFGVVVEHGKEVSCAFSCFEECVALIGCVYKFITSSQAWWWKYNFDNIHKDNGILLNMQLKDHANRDGSHKKAA